MVILEFKIEIYDWKVVYLEVNRKNKGLKKLFKKYHVPTRYLQAIKDNMVGGVHLLNRDKGESLVLIFNAGRKKRRSNIVSHEIRHLEDGILSTWAIQDKEASAALSGYIAEKMYPIKKL